MNLSHKVICFKIFLNPILNTTSREVYEMVNQPKGSDGRNQRHFADLLFKRPLSDDELSRYLANFNEVERYMRECYYINGSKWWHAFYKPRCEERLWSLKKKVLQAPQGGRYTLTF